MKWVGRVLLCVLIASALFVAKQNDFSPVAEAQTSQFEIQSCENILIELNRVVPSNVVEIIHCQREANLFGDTWNALVEFSPYVSTRTGPFPSPPEVWQNNACAPNRLVGPTHDYENCFTETPNRFNKIGQIKNFLTFGCPTVAGGHLPALGEWECHTRQESLGNDSYRMFVQTHLVFTIPTCNTGGTGGQGFLIERAHAQEVCLPDLVPDLTNIEIEMIEEGTGRTFIKRPPRIVYGREIEKMTIRGVAVKNIGSAVFEGNLTIGFRNIENALQLDPSEMVKVKKLMRIEPGQSVILDPMSFLTGNPNNSDSNHSIWDRMRQATVEYSRTSFNYTAIVDPDDSVDESNEINNTSEIANFMVWAAIKATAQFASNNAPVELVDLSFYPGTGNARGVSLSDKQGIAWLVPTNRPSAQYTIEARWSGVYVESLAPKLAVTAPQIYPVTVKISDIAAVRVDTFVDIGDNSNPRKPLVPDKGKVTIVSTANPKQTFTSEISKGVALFSATRTPGFIPGKYKPLISKEHDSLVASIDYYGVSYKPKNQPEQSAEGGRVSWFWPEPSRASEFSSQDPNDPSTTFDFTVKPLYRLEMVLPKRCDTETYSNIELCTYDSASGASSINQHPEISRVIMGAVNSIRSWKSSPLVNLNKVIIGADPVGSYYGRYDSKDPNTIQIKSGYAVSIYTVDPDNIPMVVIHEIFHDLDDYYEPNGGNTNNEYALSNRRESNTQRLKDQFNNETGVKLWDLVSFNCAYSGNCIGGYRAKAIRAKLIDGAQPTIDSAFLEALAEEKTTLCTYKKRVVNRLNNVDNELSSLWQSEYSEPLPNDYPVVRDNILSRWLGKDTQGNIVIQQFADWHNNCLAGIAGQQ